jgi:very-short-patch-repair endonuclease
MLQKIFNQKTLLKKRKNLRNCSTPFEIILWKSLQNSQLNNRKFRRQHSIGNYIADFYCPQEKLVIELDGDSHFISDTAIVYDLKRTEFFESLGIKVLRFNNREIAKNLGGVLMEVVRSFDRSHTTPTPPLRCGD